MAGLCSARQCKVSSTPQDKGLVSWPISLLRQPSRKPHRLPLSPSPSPSLPSRTQSKIPIQTLPKPEDHDYRDRDDTHGAKRHSGPEALRDQRDHLPPGTPYTAPEGHEFRNPGPGEPGGPSAGAAGSMDPPVRTIADEQRARSEAMEADGMQAWSDQHDERDPDRQPKQVPGVGPTSISAESAPPKGNSTPEARTAQHPAAPR